MPTTKVAQILLRKGLRTNLPEFGEKGELFYCTDTHQVFIGNGLDEDNDAGIAELFNSSGNLVIDGSVTFHSTVTFASGMQDGEIVSTGALGAAVAAEATDRMAADSALASTIGGVEDDLASEQAARIAADTAAIATAESYTDTKIGLLINSAPTVLDTLKELADALGDDANFAATTAAALALKAPLASPALTGNPTAPTQSALDSSTKIATTKYADDAVGAENTRAVAAEALKAPLASPALTGNPTAPTQSAGNNSTRVSTTAYTDSAVAVETARAQAAEALGELLSHKDAASGYAGLDSNGRQKTSQEWMETAALTGTPAAIIDSHRGKLVTISHTTAASLTVAQAGASSNFAAGWYCYVKNIGAGTYILTATTSTFTEGAAVQVVIPPGATFMLMSDGTNWQLPMTPVDTKTGGFSFFTTNGQQSPVIGAGGNSIVSSAAVILALVCNLEKAYFVSKIKASNVSNSSGTTQTYDMGIADSLGNLILSIGAKSILTAVSQTYLSQTVTATIFLPGTYLTCWTASVSAGFTFISTPTFVIATSASWNGNLTPPLFIKCGASPSSNAIPASLGTISTSALATGGANAIVPIILFCG